MKIADLNRYESKIAAEVAEGPSETIASIKSCYVSDGVTLTDLDEVTETSRMSIVAVIEFPEIFEGKTLLAELTGVERVNLWDDIDSDHRCVGRIDWFGDDASTLHLAAHLTLATLQQFRCLLLECESDTKSIEATAIGLASIEFYKRELPKGVAVTNVSVSTRKNFVEALE